MPNKNKFASLAAARERMDAVTRGEALPDKDPAPAARTGRQSRLVKPLVLEQYAAKEVVSIDYCPDLMPVATGPVNGIDVATANFDGNNSAISGGRGLKFSTLKLGQDRMNVAPKELREPREGNDGASVSGARNQKFSTVSAEQFSQIEREVKLKELHKMADAVAAYYHSSTESSAKEKAYLASLFGPDFDDMMLAYKCAFSHVTVMTSDAKAQSLALNSSSNLNSFYEKHGTNEETLDIWHAKNSDLYAYKGKSSQY